MRSPLTSVSKPEATFCTPSISRRSQRRNPGDAMGSMQVSPEQRERAADTGARAAWSTLVALLLGLGAAAAGGYLGARTLDERDHRDSAVATA